MRELLAELVNVLDQGRDCVYCAVVETRGSTPQKAGSAMLVFPDGSQRGTLGGGCVEAEVKQRALGVLHTAGQKPEVLTFCLDDNYGWDDGLICGGRMSILAAPISRSPSPVQEYYRRFHQLVEAGQGCTEAVVVAANVGSLPAGNRFLFDPQGKLIARIGGEESNGSLPPAVADGVVRHLVPLTQRPRPAVHQGIAYLPILPRITLFIVGGGHVGQAVAQLGAQVDFDIWVLDDRERYASRERFPMASRLLVGDIGATLKELAPREINPSVYCIITTRGHAHDEEALYHLAPLTLPSPPAGGEGKEGNPSPPAGEEGKEGNPSPLGGEGRVRGAGYVGMIGSKRKIKLIYEDLIAKGVPAEALDRVHAPLGFAIGSQTVPEIAVSIVAELIACRNLGATIPEARVRVRANHESTKVRNHEKEP